MAKNERKGLRREAGKASSAASDVYKRQAHHIAILAKQKGVGLVVAGHWGTEHPVVFALADALTERLPKEVTVAPSLADVDPYSYL